MVAIAGTGWVLAPSLVAYVLEADRYYPQRDRSADGSIGDLAHQARVSDHNPDDGYVHAVDLDEDLAPGLDMKGFADKLLRRRDPRIAYVIYEGRIFKSYRDSAGHAPWTWMPYTGTNAHLHHLHLSILHTDAARNNLDQWGFAPLVTPPQEDDLDAKEHQWLEVTTKRVRLLEEKIDRLYDAFFENASRPPSGNLAARMDVTYEKVKQL